MRPIWKGAISFGLVNIPVGLYSAASKTERIKFRLLRASDQSPIRNKRVAEVDGKEVPWEEIAKGYEYESRTPDMGVFENVRFFSRGHPHRVVQAKSRSREDGHCLVKFLAKRGDRTGPVWRTQRR